MIAILDAVRSALQRGLGLGRALADRLFARPRFARSFGPIRSVVAIGITAALVGGSAVSFSSSDPAAAVADHSDDTALSLNNSYASVNAQVIPSSGSFTVQTWFKDTSTDSGLWPVVLSQGTSTSFRIQRNGGGAMYWQYGGFSSQFGWHVPANQWTHVSFVYTEASSGNTVRIYLNGNLSYSWNPGSTKLAGVGPNFFLGGFSNSTGDSNYRMKGSFDETRVYKRALTQSEVQTSMHTYGPANAPGLLAYYDFNDKTLTHKSSSADALTGGTLGVTGTTAWEDIAKTNTVGNQKYVAFTKSYLSKDGGWPLPAGAATINYLAVGGGGGSGARHAGGGGGGAVVQGVKVSVTDSQQFDVVVGPGGIAGIDARDGTNGGQTKLTGTLSSISATAPGGGGGGGGNRAGLKGASGGGGGASSGAGADGTSGLGNAGGGGRFYRYDNGGENWHGGGGGGAATAGARPNGYGDWMRTGNGGNGKSISWLPGAVATALSVGHLHTDSLVYFGGGGAGGKMGHGGVGTAGLGGGGSAHSNARANTGGGGGGGGDGSGGGGASGLVLISYSTVPNVPQNFSAKAVTDKQVDLTWSEPAVNGASVTEYVIEYSLASDFSTGVTTATVAKDPLSATQTYSINTLAEATQYYFRVKAKNPTTTGAATAAKDAKTWVKVQNGDCVTYASTSTGVSTGLSGGDSCEVTFASGSVEWAVPPGVTKLDTLVVGGGGGGGSQAGSGGAGGSVVDLGIDLGASKIPSLKLVVGAGGAAGAAGSSSTLTGTDGTNTVSVTSTGGPGGKSSTTAPTASVNPTATKTGTALTLLERAKRAPTAGGAGKASTDTSATGSAGTAGYTPASIFSGSYSGGGGGGPVAGGLTTRQHMVAVSGVASGSSWSSFLLSFTDGYDVTSWPAASDYTVPGAVVNEAKNSGVSWTQIYFSFTGWPTAGELTYTKGTTPLTLKDGGVVQSFTLTGISTDGTQSTQYVPVLSSKFVTTTAGTGGQGGGGSSATHTGTGSTSGTVTAAVAGTANTGGGGGAGVSTGDATTDVGAAGGSGVVKILYKLVSPPLVLTSPEDATVAAGDSVSFSASFGSVVSSIQWQFSSNLGKTWENVGSPTTNSATSTYTIASALTTQSGYWYRAKGTNTVGSASASSDTASASLTVTKDAETLPVGAFCDGSSTQNGLTTTAGHGKVFYIDSSPGQEIDAAYVAYSIKSTANRDDLWVEISGFSGGVISLADPSTSTMPLGSVGANSSGAAYFLLKASQDTQTAQSHVIRVYNQKPTIGNPKPIYECSYSFTRVEETIKTSTNTVDSVALSTTVFTVGSTMTVTVKGDSGTIGQGNDVDGRMLWLTPAARSSWPVGSVRLEETKLNLFTTKSDRDAATPVPIASFDDVLRVNDLNGLPADAQQFWTATYTFRVMGPASSKAPIVPISMISSGTQIMHTDVAATTATELNLADPPPAVKLKVTKSVSAVPQVRDDGTTRFEYVVNLKNEDTVSLTVDEVIDSPDSKLAYVTGSATYNDAVVTTTDGQSFTTYEEIGPIEPAKIGTTSSLGFSGPLVVPAGSTRTIKYSMAMETCKTGNSYSLDNTATAQSGSIVIGSGSATRSLVTLNANCGDSSADVFVDDVAMDPTVVTGQANSVAETTATITGVIDPNGVAGRALRFSYSTSATLAGALVKDLATTSTSEAPEDVSQGLSGLTAGTTYYYRLEVEVSGTWVLGEILTFKTLPAAALPVVGTTAVTGISPAGTSVTFTGTIDANLTTGGVKTKFEYGLAGAGGSCAPAASSLTSFLQSGSADALVTGYGPTPMSFTQTGLSANTAYCVRIVGYHGASFATVINGDWVPFTTTAKLSQQIVWSTGSKPLPAGGTTTVSAFADSGLAVTYASVDATKCTVDSQTGAVTAVATSGNCVITATQPGGTAGDKAYDAATPSTMSFLISPPQVTTTSLPVATYSTGYTHTLKASGGNDLYSSWAWTGDKPNGLVLNPATGVITGAPTLSGIYVVSVTTVSNGVTSEPQPLTLVVNKVTVTVTASSATLTFGDGAPQVTASYDEDAFLSPDTSAIASAEGNVEPTCQTTYTAGMFVGDETAYSSCSGGWATNYSYSYLIGTITILPMELTISVVPAAKKEGSADPTFTYTVSPSLPPGQVLVAASSPPVIPNHVLKAGEVVTFTRAAGTTPGEYTITPAAVLQETYPYLDANGDQYVESGVGQTKPYENYNVTFKTAPLTITAKKTPTLETTNGSVTYGTSLTGLLSAQAKDGASIVPGTYRYSYQDENGSSVTVTNSTVLPAGTYSITATFTPTDSVTYFGPISSVFTVTVNPYAVTLRALDAAKQNLRSTTQLTVSLDPDFDYLLSPQIPGGQQFSDVYPNGVTVSRALAGTAAGKYPITNLTILAKEDSSKTYVMTPSGEISPNYKATIVKGVFTITEKLVPTIDANDVAKTVGNTLGTSLSATATIDGAAVPGTFVYSYFDSTGAEVVVTSATTLPLGLYSILVKFTPTNATTYYGPVYGSMIVTVNPVVASNNNNGGPVVKPPTVQPPNNNQPGNRRGPTQNPQNGNGGNNGANSNFTNAGGATNGGGDGFGGGNGAGFYTVSLPFAPGFGSLMVPGAQSANGGDGAGGGAAGNGSSNGNGTQGGAGGSGSTQSQMANMLSGMTVDVGRGIEPAQAAMVSSPFTSLSEGSRTLAQVADERLRGFYPPGSGVRIEVLGAKTGARFQVARGSSTDVQAVMQAMSNSIEAQQSDFFSLQEISSVTAPQMPAPWSAQEQRAIAEFFQGAGLAEPLSLASIDPNQVSNWIGVRASASTYVPGSVVYLTVTSTPLVLGSAVVDENGDVTLQGAIPLEFLESGEHRIRLVGMRALDGVYVDDAGEIQVTDQTMAELNRFDLHTNATIAFIGSNEGEGNHVALRVVAIDPVSPWWALFILGLMGLAIFVMRRRDTVFTEERKTLGATTIILAALPAVIMGFLNSATSFAWWSLALSLVLAVGSWFVTARKVRDRSRSFA